MDGVKRFRIEPRDVPAQEAARRLGKTLAEFDAILPKLIARGFPKPDPDQPRDRGFWEPTPKMQALGFTSIPCGPDGPGAWAIAEEWERRWQATRNGETPSPAMVSSENLSPEQSEELTVYPPRSLGEAFRRYRRTHEWAGKAPRTREDWWRAWNRVKPIFGDTDPRPSRSKTSAHGGRRLRTPFRYARHIERSKSGAPCGRSQRRSATASAMPILLLACGMLPPTHGLQRGLKARLYASISARGAKVIMVWPR